MDIDLLVTSINTMDNVKTIKGSNIFANTIQNLAANLYCLVNLVAQLINADLKVATAMSKQHPSQSPNMMTDLCQPRMMRFTIQLQFRLLSVLAG